MQSCTAQALMYGGSLAAHCMMAGLHGHASQPLPQPLPSAPSLGHGQLGDLSWLAQDIAADLAADALLHVGGGAGHAAVQL